MFTGIVREIGVINKISHQKGSNNLLLVISSKKIGPRVGDSVCVQGVCLTVVSRDKKGFSLEIVPETMNLTNLKNLIAGSPVNLESSLRPSDTMDGGFVLGHVDTVGVVKKLVTSKNGIYLSVQFPNKLKPLIAEKGSITLNGVNLTIAKVSKNIFSVAMIPFTLKNTTLGNLKNGDEVNIEADILARYLYNMR